MFSIVAAHQSQAPRFPLDSSQLQCFRGQRCPSRASLLPRNNPQLCMLAKHVITWKAGDAAALLWL